MNSPKLIYAESNSFDPYFNLSLEKYLFEHVEEGEVIFYLWQNEKTIVCGRNQNVFKECNITETKCLGGKIARRESGGGAVFHDVGNLNFTFIARGDLYDVDKNLQVIETAVSRFGLTAVRTGRNDLTILGKKFSGNAFHKVGDRHCHHGTIMIDVNALLLSSLLNVSHDKLESKGVASVESRVQNLHDFDPSITIDSMREELKDSFLCVYGADHFSEVLVMGGGNLTGAGKTSWTSASSMLTMLQSISEYRKDFSSDAWIYGKNPNFTNTISKRFDWGEIEFGFEFEEGLIKSARVFSDSLTPNFITEIEANLQGVKYDADEINKIVDLAAKTCNEEVSVCCLDIKELISASI